MAAMAIENMLAPRMFQSYRLVVARKKAAFCSWKKAANASPTSNKTKGMRRDKNQRNVDFPKIRGKLLQRPLFFSPGEDNCPCMVIRRG